MAQDSAQTGFSARLFDLTSRRIRRAAGGPYRFDDFVADALGLFDALGIARCHFVGLSMGGMVAQHLALAAPERIASLVLADTSSRFGPEVLPIWDERMRTAREQGMAPLVEPTLARWFTERAPGPCPMHTHEQHPADHHASLTWAQTAPVHDCHPHDVGNGCGAVGACPSTGAARA